MTNQYEVLQFYGLFIINTFWEYNFQHAGNSVPQSYHGEAKEQSQWSSNFCQEWLQGVDQGFLFHYQTVARISKH